MTTTAVSSTPSSPLPSPVSSLWARLLDHRDSSNPTTSQPPSHAQLTLQDKVGTSTRILLHDTHARLENFSERANSIFSGIEASRREMVRVREEVESAREEELDTIAQLSTFCLFFRAYMLVIVCSYNTYIFAPVNRCQSSLQRTIGEPAQAREAAMMHASLTVTTERLQALEEKINSKLDALTAVQSSPILLAEKTSNHIVLHVAPSSSKPVDSISPRAVFARPESAEPDPRAACATPPDPPVRAASHKHRAQRHLGEDTPRLPVSMYRQLFEPTQCAFPPYATIGGECRATFGDKKKKED